MILFLINTAQFPYHKRVSKEFEKALKEVIPDSDLRVELYDRDASKPLHEVFDEIRGYDAELIFTFDLAGFDLVTSNGTLSLNSLPIRIINILLKSSDFYKDRLKQRQNLSMFTFFSVRDNVEFDNDMMDFIPNPGRLCEYEYKDESKECYAHNEESLTAWMKDILMDLLPQQNAVTNP